MQYWKASTILQVPEESRQILYDSGVYMVNDCFLPLYEEYHYLIDLWGGRGSGKSHHAVDFADYLLQGKEYCRVAFLRLHLDSVRDSLWLDFNDRLEERQSASLYKITQNNMRAECLATGNKLVCKGVRASKSQTAKLKSLAGFTHVIIDEADEIPKEDFQKLVDSIRKKGIKIMIIRMFNTPRKSHYIWDDYTLTPVPEYEGYYTAVPLPDSGIKAIWTNYTTNIHNLNEKFLIRYNNAKNGKDLNYYLTDVCGYIPSGHKGQIYKGWSRISLAEYNNLDWNKYYYNDWGNNDPNALGEVKVHNRMMMVKGLMYKPIETLQLAIFLAQKGFTNELIICDSSQPRSIIELQGYDEEMIDAGILDKYPQLRDGFNTIGVPKPSGSLIDGIKLLQSYDVYVVEDEESEHIWNEYLGYMWELDKDGKPTDQPIDKNNHHMDGIRYIAYCR